MQTKLTLRLDDQLIRRAKLYARKSGKSVSELVADLFGRLHAPNGPAETPLSPVVKRLAGSLTGKNVQISDYRKYQADKFR
jgi:hypothetical protein